MLCFSVNIHVYNWLVSLQHSGDIQTKEYVYIILYVQFVGVLKTANLNKSNLIFEATQRKTWRDLQSLKRSFLLAEEFWQPPDRRVMLRNLDVKLVYHLRIGYRCSYTTTTKCVPNKATFSIWFILQWM
jgi:hypothetical protein